MGGIPDLNWLNFAAYVGTTVGIVGFMLAIIGWMFKKWMIEVDKRLEELLRKNHESDVKFAALPASYTTREDYNLNNAHMSQKRENLWKSYRDVDKRVTIIETTLKIKGEKKS